MGKEALNWLGELAIIHTTGVETDGRYCMIELYATKEGSPPWHVHQREDEGFYVLEGELTVFVGDKTYKAKAGDYLLAPKGIPHTYTVDSPGYARVMLICSPAGFEEAVRQMSTPAESLEPPKNEDMEIDYDKISSLAAQYGVEFVDAP
ncbi:cupin domain-containing protein [Litoribacter populi]|uniref:cupin domain-containing protein n=1 Tax=Litoribacter populi TaxID=2598460 RepID=UPI001181468B|nr:cupin domain-containing protein [Litoribacter populi]